MFYCSPYLLLMIPSCSQLAPRLHYCCGTKARSSNAEGMMSMNGIKGKKGRNISPYGTTHTMSWCYVTVSATTSSTILKG